MKPLKDKSLFHLLFILFASAVIMAPVMFYGVPYGTGDFVHHLQISQSYFDSFTNGIFLPNWFLHGNDGLGAVTARFYPPLIHITIAVSRILTGDWQAAIYTAFTFWSFVGGAGMYFWTKDFLPHRRQSLFAALLFIITPYHLNQFFNSFMFGEFAALSLMPFLLAYTKKISAREKFADLAGFAISMGLIVLSNLPQTIIAFLIVIAYFLLSVDKVKILRQTMRLGIAGFLGLALTAFYWVRVVYEMNFLNIAQPNTDPHYDFRHHFLLSNSSFDEGGVWFANYIFAVCLLLTVGALLTTGSIATVWREKAVRNVTFIGLFAIFMMIPASSLIWEFAPALQKVQFPWRFLSIISLCVSVLFAYALGFLNAENYLRKRPFVLILVGLITIFAVFSVKQIALSGLFMPPSEFAILTEKSINAKNLWHWQPIWLNNGAFETQKKARALNRGVTITAKEAEIRKYRIEDGEATSFEIDLIFYPHWQAEVNNQRIETVKTVNGLVEISVPRGEALVELKFIEPTYSLFSRLISAVALIGVFLFGSVQYFRGKLKHQ